MAVYNLMPHACTVVFPDGSKMTLESEGELRLKSATQKTLPSVNGIPTIEPQSFTGVDESTGKGFALFKEKRLLGARVAFVVSSVTAQWLAEHDDSGCCLLAPATGPAHAVRDSAGRIVGCRALERY